MGEHHKTVGLSPWEEIASAIRRIEEAFQALDFGGARATEEARAQIAQALGAIRHQLDQAGRVASTEAQDSPRRQAAAIRRQGQGGPWSTSSPSGRSGCC